MEKGALLLCWREQKLGQPLWKSVWKLLRITEREHSATQRNPSQHTTDMHICVFCCTLHSSQEVGLTEMFIGARLDKARVTYVHSENYSSIKKNGMVSFAGKQPELECIMLMKQGTQSTWTREGTTGRQGYKRR